jgi:signal transduction histidine kinase
MSRGGIAMSDDCRSSSLDTFHKALVNVRDVNRLLNLIVEAITDVFKVTNSALVLRERDTETLSVKACTGLDKEFLDGLKFKQNEGIFFWLRRNRRILLIDESVETEVPMVSADIRKEADFLRARVCAPLETNGVLIGYLTLGAKIAGKPFEDPELVSLFRLGKYAAEAIGNALSFNELDSQKTHLERIIETVEMGIVAVDAECRIIALNRTAGMLLDAAPDEIIGRHAQQLGSVFSDILMQTLQTRRSYDRETISNPVTKTLLEVSTSILRSGQGATVGAIAIFSEAPAAGISTDQASEKHAETWKYLAERLTDYIGNALVPIKVFMHEPEKKIDSGTILNDIEKQIGNPERSLEKLIDIISDFADSPAVSLREHNMEQFLAGFVNDKREYVEEKGAAIEFESRLTDSQVQFDSLRLGEALKHAIQNSIESFEEEKAARTIKVVAQDSQEKPQKDQSAMIEILVIDNGKGIAEENIDKVFEPFFMKDKGTKRLGLGLSIIRTTAETHGGSAEIESEKGKGTTLRIKLPKIPPAKK